MEETKKRNKITLLIIFVAVFLVITGGYLLFKGNSGKPAEDVAELFAKLKAEGDTSIELLDKAVADKKLDAETALVYKVYAVYGDDKLPAEYNGKFFYEGTQVVREMTEKWDKLSKKTKELLAPFTKRPDEDGSWMNLKYGEAEPKPTSWLYGNAYAVRPGTYTEYFTSTDEKVKIWYPSAPAIADTGEKMAKMITAHLDNDAIIEKFEALLQKQLMSDGTKGGDGKLDIYVAPIGSNLGLTYAETATPTPSHILMNLSIGVNSDTVLKTTLAHEIFHSFQYTYKHDASRDNWWAEATAVWSEDFIYPSANTEHEWLDLFMPYPMTEADKENPPKNHHYATYILPYFITKNFGDDFMRKSWEACVSGPCIDGIDKNITGGLKDQWKEFTLWNYNKEPAKFYTDMGSFPADSSAQSANYKQEMVADTPETTFETEKLNPLSAGLSEVLNMVADKDKIKKLTFTDLENFTGKADSTSIKAVIYYKNGKNAVEDWAKLKKRSFCIDSNEEDFEKVVLIFSNSDKKKEVPSAKLKVVSKNSCFEINQDDKRTGAVHYKWNTGSVSANTTIDTRSDGEPVADPPKDADFAYQTKWKLWWEFEQVRDAFSFPCEGGSADFTKGWTSRYAGYIEFDLSPDKVGKDGTFPIDLIYGYAHPNGISEEVPTLNVKCDVPASIGARSFDATPYKGSEKGIYTGKITEMTVDGAKIAIPNSCMWDYCDFADHSGRYQDISEPISLEIKRVGK